MLLYSERDNFDLQGIPHSLHYPGLFAGHMFTCKYRVAGRGGGEGGNCLYMAQNGVSCQIAPFCQKDDKLLFLNKSKITNPRIHNYLFKILSSDT